MEKMNEKIKRLRKQEGISQVEIAKAAGITQSSYASIEKGITKSITIDVGKGFAKALGISFNELFDIESDSQKGDKLNFQIEELNKKISEQEKIINLHEHFAQNFKMKVLESSDFISKYFMAKLIDIMVPLKGLNEDQKKIIVNMFSAYNVILQDQLVLSKWISREDIKSFNDSHNLDDMYFKTDIEIQDK